MALNEQPLNNFAVNVGQAALNAVVVERQPLVIEAEKMQIYRAYEPGRAIAYAKRLAGLDDHA